MNVFSPCQDMILDLKLVSYEILHSVLSNDMQYISKLLIDFDASLG